MINPYVQSDYEYAVARLRHHELGMIDRQTMDQLISTPTYEELIRTLRDKLFGDRDVEDTDGLMRLAEREMWDFVDEIVPDMSEFDVFRLEYDYGNLKGAIKEQALSYEYPGIYSEFGTAGSELIRRAAAERDYTLLPERLAEAAKEAQELFTKTGDGQLCDIICDRAALEAVWAAGSGSEDEFIRDYAQLKVIYSTIKIAARCALTGKDREFIKMAVPSDCPAIDVVNLINAASGGIDSLTSFLGSAGYQDVVQQLRKSFSSFEVWADNAIIERMKPQLYESAKLGPVAAYIAARLSELRSLRIIILAKKNGFPEEIIRERVRETYV